MSGVSQSGAVAPIRGQGGAPDTRFSLTSPAVTEAAGAFSGRRLDDSEAARIAAQYGAIVKVQTVVICPPRTFALSETLSHTWIEQRDRKAASKARQVEMQALRQRERREEKPARRERDAQEIAFARAARAERNRQRQREKREALRRAGMSPDAVKNAVRKAKREELARQKAAALGLAEPIRDKNGKLRKPGVFDLHGEAWVALVRGGMKKRAAAAKLGLSTKACDRMAETAKLRGIDLSVKS